MKGVRGMKKLFSKLDGNVLMFAVFTLTGTVFLTVGAWGEEDEAFFWYMISSVFFFLAVYRLLKYWKRKYGQNAAESVSRLYSRIGSFWRKLFDSFFAKLGFTRRNTYRGSDNQHSFVFSFGSEKKERKKFFHVYPKWKDATDNALRIRHVYMRYILGCTRKGYRFKTCNTPSETKKELEALRFEDCTEISELYIDARYSPDAKISDETVEKYKKYT